MRIAPIDRLVSRGGASLLENAETMVEYVLSREMIEMLLEGTGAAT